RIFPCVRVGSGKIHTHCLFVKVPGVQFAHFQHVRLCGKGMEKLFCNGYGVISAHSHNCDCTAATGGGQCDNSIGHKLPLKTILYHFDGKISTPCVAGEKSCAKILCGKSSRHIIFTKKAFTVEKEGGL